VLPAGGPDEELLQLMNPGTSTDEQPDNKAKPKRKNQRQVAR
jgi:hypothetical protein